MVLSYSRKAISGWNNYPCIVISHKIDEKKMGNRGSKSEFILNSVKEQRADDSWCIKLKLMHLRYALMGFERNYQINNPSNQYNKLPFSSRPGPLGRDGTILIQKPKLNLWFITGFADAESSFVILIQPNSKYKTN